MSFSSRLSVWVVIAPAIWAQSAIDSTFFSTKLYSVLEAAGCRGLQVGGAKFSDKHANFVENAGDATTADILSLMAEGRRRVHERFGVSLQPEVQILGEVEWPQAWDLGE